MDGRAVAFNLLVSLLRFANIFFLTSVPLLAAGNKELLGATPYVGLSSLVLVCLALVSAVARRLVLRTILIVVSLTGALLLALFAGLPVPQWFESFWMYLLLSILLGVSLAGTEMLGLYLALSTPERNVLRGNLALFNGLKVAGYAFGFLFGTIAASGGFAKIVAHCGIAALSISLCGLALYVRGRFWAEELSAFSMAEDPARDPLALGPMALLPAIRRSWHFLLFIVADVAVFSFWYVYIPYRLHTLGGISLAVVGGWLSLQAFVHAFSQYLWKMALSAWGEVIGYGVSLTAHVAVVFVITHLAPLDYTILTGLFVAMGVVNSGTYISSGVLFHTAANLGSKTQSAAAQQAASSVGKWLGTLAANTTIR